MADGSAPRLSLDSLTLTDTRPQDLIRAAATAGFDLCSLWVLPPALYPSPLLTPELERECAAILADTGMAVGALEVFDLYSKDAVEAAKPQLELGARLGGQAALAINYSNPDREETADILALFAEAARQFGMATNLEPVAGGQSQTLAQARDLIRASGADVGICFDPHHLIRSGGGVADLQEIELGLIRYVQVCDGPVPQPPEIAATEAVCERLYPGDGNFPLVDLMRAAPRGGIVGIECPSLRRAAAGMTATQQRPRPSPRSGACWRKSAETIAQGGGQKCPPPSVSVRGRGPPSCASKVHGARRNVAIDRCRHIRYHVDEHRWSFGADRSGLALRQQKGRASEWNGQASPKAIRRHAISSATQR